MRSDLSDAAAVLSALDGQGVAVSCGGPFSRIDLTLPEACLRARCAYVDIADDRRYVARLRERSAAFAEQGVAAVFGCSSLPGISGALAAVAKDGVAAAIARARVTLFIGNQNPKGLGAISSLVESLGRPIETAERGRYVFGSPERVPLPEPLGPRWVYDVESPDLDLFPEVLGTKAVSVKVGFELGIASRTFALLARLGPRWGRRTAACFEVVGRIGAGGGTPVGAVMSELFFWDGTARRAALTAELGQRMAALPAVVAAMALFDGATARGVLTAYELCGARPLLDALVAEGSRLTVSPL
ncbi:MAG: hypothetical protein U0166_10185 [Acidobacteriota bacterium]